MLNLTFPWQTAPLLLSVHFDPWQNLTVFEGTEKQHTLLSRKTPACLVRVTF
jgi:hypothetical protein